MPTREIGVGIAGTTTPAFFAAQERLVPCTSSDTNTIKKATLKNSWALSKPAINGKTARMTGTAPRNPTQEIKQRSRKLNPLKGNRPRKTDNGRANKIIQAERKSAGNAMGSSSLGV